MNCDAIDTIIDDHGTQNLAPAQRAGVDQHLAACPRCADAWLANDLLRREAPEGPPPALLAAVLRRIEHEAEARTGRARPRSPTLWAAAAAAAALAAAAVLFLPRSEQVPPTPAEGDPVAVQDERGGTESSAADELLADSPLRPRTAPYRTLLVPLPTDVERGRIEVAEFFTYGCDDCYLFERRLERWAAAAPADVVVVRIPTLFGPLSRLHAQAFYAADALGKLPEMHAAFYEEVRARGNTLDSEAALAEFFGRFGVDARTFRAAFHSAEVRASLERADRLAVLARVTETPTLLVNGRYVTSPSGAESYEQWLATVEQLVGIERSRLQRSEPAGGPASRVQQSVPATRDGASQASTDRIGVRDAQRPVGEPP